MVKFKSCEMETHLFPSKNRKKVTRLSTVHEARRVNKERGYTWHLLCAWYIVSFLTRQLLITMLQHCKQILENSDCFQLFLLLLEEKKYSIYFHCEPRHKAERKKGDR